MRNSKSIKIGLHEIWVFLTLAGAFGLRVLLAREYWPLPNSDETTLGLMAMHIQHGEHPTFFYGQYYLGPLEAYVAAMFFYPFGSSIFILRLVQIIIYILFLVSIYLLARTLYNKNIALFTLVILSIGSNAILSRQVSAIEGYIDTLLFSTLAFLLATWLALAPAGGPLKKRIWRLAGFAGFGLVIGLGIWCNLLILPFALCALCVLLLFCRRELVRGAIIPLLICLIIGASPLICYNLGPKPPGKDSWSVLNSLQGRSPWSVENIQVRIQQTVTLSLPAITGSPFCHQAEFPQLFLLGYESNAPNTAQCLEVGSIWSISYLLLILIAICNLLLARAKTRFTTHTHGETIQEKEAMTRYMVQILIIISTILMILIFIRSQDSFVYPSIHSRYMIDLWIATPVLLWPLWLGATIPQSTRHWRGWLLLLVRAWTCRALLLLILLIFLFGTWKTMGEIPAARNAAGQEQGLINILLKAHITHIYSEYWTCGRIEFESLERITCGTLTPGLVPSLNRYQHYYEIVSHDPNTSYMFPLSFRNGSLIVQRLRRQRRRYHVFLVDDYVVYQPKRDYV